MFFADKDEIQARIEEILDEFGDLSHEPTAVIAEALADGVYAYLGEAEEPKFEVGDEAESDY